MTRGGLTVEGPHLNQGQVGPALRHAAPVDGHAGVVVQITEGHVLNYQTAVYPDCVAWGQKLSHNEKLSLKEKSFQKE